MEKTVLLNIFKLKAITEIYGHSIDFPCDEFLNIFNEDSEYYDWVEKKGYGEELIKLNDYEDCSWEYSYEFLEEEYNLDDLIPEFESGHKTISDFALEPLLKLSIELDFAKTPEAILVIINKILDVTHPRGDIAELFIVGGSKSLDVISNS